MKKPPLTEQILTNALFLAAKAYLAQLQPLKLGKIILFLRKRLRMSQKTLAKRAKIPASSLSRIESGYFEPNLNTVQKIFEALFCDLAILPLPRQDLDQLVQKRIRSIAEKRVRHLKGTMALELQQPSEEALNMLIEKETQRLITKNNVDLWQEG